MNNQSLLQEHKDRIESILQNWAPNQRLMMTETIYTWLANFQPSEYHLMITLLSKLQFISETDVQDLLKLLAEQLKRVLGVNLNKTNFFPLGDYASESGSNYLYLLRKYLGAPEHCFPSSHFEQVNSKDLSAMVFIDDIICSGNQATTFFKTRLADISVDKYYVALYAFNDGLEKLKAETQFKSVIAAKILSEEYKAFSDKSQWFQNSTERDAIRNICKEYGKKLYPKGPLGYDDSQCLLVFPHTVPNNTLPVVWAGPKSESNPTIVWRPLRARIKVESQKRYVDCFTGDSDQIAGLISVTLNPDDMNVVSNLRNMVDIAVGNIDRKKEIMEFLRDVNWWDSDYNARLDFYNNKMVNTNHPSGNDLLNLYSNNDKMEVVLSNYSVYLPQQLISSNIQGKFDECFVELSEDCYKTEPFEYNHSFKKICSLIEEAKKQEILHNTGKLPSNGRNLRLSNMKIIHKNSKPYILTAHQPVYYWTGLGTNYSLDSAFNTNNTSFRLREILHKNGKLCHLSQSMLANPIGINILIISADGQLILQHRDKTPAVRPSEACSSASGTVDDKDVYHKDFSHPILAALFRETEEEIAVRAEDLHEIVFLGAIREFLRGGLTDFFFASKCSLSAAEIASRAVQEGKAVDRWEWESLADTSSSPKYLMPDQISYIFYLNKYVELLLQLRQPASLPLLTNILLLAKFQSENPGIL